MATIKSTLFLCKNVDLDPEYNYTIDFDNEDAQKAYFDEKIEHIIPEENYSYIRETERIKVEKNIDDLFGINYLMYENKNKRYYGFITNKEYVNPECTRLTFKLDVFQSYMFDYEIDESFIDREHQDRFNIDGTPIYNTQDENVNYGKKYKQVAKHDLKHNAIERTNADGSKTTWKDGYMILVSIEKWDGDTFKNSITQGNFLENPFYCYAFPMVEEIRTAIDGTQTKSFAPSINNNIQLVSGSTTKVMKEFGMLLKSDEIKTDKVKAIYFTSHVEQINDITDDTGIPTFNVGNILELKFTVDGETISFPCLRVFGQSSGQFNSITKNVQFDISTLSKDNLKNKKFETKLFTNPFYYLQLDNKQTQPLTLLNEYLPNEINVKVKTIQNIMPKSMYEIDGYLNNTTHERLVDASIVDLPLLNDAYLNYMQQNKASATAGIAVAGVQTIAGLALGAITGGIGLAVAGSSVLSFGGQIANELIKREDLKQTPDNVKAEGNNGYFTLASHEQGLSLIEYSITDEYQDKIFKYLFHYGYKCNDFKKPDTRSRYYFNYIKTIGVNLKTNIDADVKNEIASIYNNGITIWHFRDADTFKGVNNYDYENAEMSLEV